MGCEFTVFAEDACEGSPAVCFDMLQNAVQIPRTIGIFISLPKTQWGVVN